MVNPGQSLTVDRAVDSRALIITSSDETHKIGCSDLGFYGRPGREETTRADLRAVSTDVNT